MTLNVTQKILQAHLDENQSEDGYIAIRFDQTLCQDATGTLVMLALEAMGLDRTKAKVSVQYVDHNLIQEDNKNPDDHLFLLSAAKQFGIVYSRPGNGISHPLHMQNFGKPGETLIGSDSHTCAAGSLGMFAMGAGGADVAMAIAGETVLIPKPKVFGVRLVGKLPEWVSAKDVILEMLKRHGVKGGVNQVIEYFGPGVANLSIMDRHVIANMGAELGATGTVFPSDQVTQKFLRDQGREDDWVELQADAECQYDTYDEINLDELVPLIAKPSSPQNVVPVSEVQGEPIYQAYIGSSANPGFRDFAMVAAISKNATLPNDISLDINPSTRQLIQQLAATGYLEDLIQVGARLHQAGCNGCIGMGQAPATGRNSLRTTPRNFPGRSGSPEDSVWLCSPEVAAASALTGEITDPRCLPERLNISYPKLKDEPIFITKQSHFVFPEDGDQEAKEGLVKGPNIKPLPQFDPLPDVIRIPLLACVEDNISTDEIMPAGADVLPFRSNIPKISQFCFRDLIPEYVKNAESVGDHGIVAGENYGQGSSREHAALAPRYLGLRVVLAQSFARIHMQNLINYGVLPLLLEKEQYEAISELSRGEKYLYLTIDNLRNQLSERTGFVEVGFDSSLESMKLKCDVGERQIKILMDGSITNWLKRVA